MPEPRPSWKFAVHPIWRIPVAMLLAGVPGALIGSSLAPLGDAFLDCWYGAAFTMPLGFLFGLLWQTQASRGSLNQHRWVVIGYGLFAVLLPVVGVSTYVFSAAACAAPNVSH